MFAGRVALVTGGTSGIGAAAVQAFAEQGAQVVFVGRRERLGESLGNRIGTGAHFIATDLTQPTAASDVVDSIIQEFGRLDFAFNNAGVFDQSSGFHNYSDVSWSTIIETNLTAVFRCMRAELAVMAGRGGVIVNNASTVAVRGSERASPAYTAAKHGVLGITRQAALEYAMQGVRVNAVGPGPTATDIAAPLAALAPDALHQHLQPVNPMARLITPEEVAQAVVFLCSDQASMINGHMLPLDGGQLAKL